MGQYKTVKEVCALTGLTGKHLYYFHHENVVRAAAYANYSVEGNDGYKLYDEAGVEKLQQIALLYELGLKRNEIRDLMRSPDYTFEAALKELRDRKNGEMEKIRRQLAAMDYLKCVGIQGGSAGIFHRCSLEELGRCLMEQKTDMQVQKINQIRQFEEGLSKFILEISNFPGKGQNDSTETEQIRRLLALSWDCFGEAGEPFLIGLLISISGGGEFGKTMRELIPPELATEILKRMEKFPQMFVPDTPPKVGV